MKLTQLELFPKPKRRTQQQINEEGVTKCRKILKEVKDGRNPVSECEHGVGYIIKSRNLRYGVWREDVSGFIGIRQKFNSLFLFTEYYSDTGGTARPFLKDIASPVTDLSEEHLVDGGYRTNYALFGWLAIREADLRCPNRECKGGLTEIRGSWDTCAFCHGLGLVIDE